MIDNYSQGVYDHDFVLKNNPIEKHVSAFINNSNLGQNEELNKAIRKQFGAKAKITADDLYHGGYETADGLTFKEAVDSLFMRKVD